MTTRRYCAEHQLAADRREAQRKEAARRTDHLPGGGRLYDRTAWRRIRTKHLRKQPWCVACEANGVRRGGEEVDHIAPHHGDVGRFYDADNLQTLCKPCHSRKTAREVGFGCVEPRRLANV